MTRSGGTNFIGLGNREDINNVHTSVCGTVPVRNMRGLIRFVGGFRRRGTWYVELGPVVGFLGQI